MPPEGDTGDTEGCGLIFLGSGHFSARCGLRCLVAGRSLVGSSQSMLIEEVPRGGHTLPPRGPGVHGTPRHSSQEFFWVRVLRHLRLSSRVIAQLVWLSNCVDYIDYSPGVHPLVCFHDPLVMSSCRIVSPRWQRSMSFFLPLCLVPRHPSLSTQLGVHLLVCTQLRSHESHIDAVFGWELIVLNP